LARDLRPTSGFLAVYLLTCYIGALALLLGPDWIRQWYVYLSGASIDPLSARDVLVVIALLHLGPALLCLGWVAGGRLLARLPASESGQRSVLRGDAPVIVGLFAASLAYLAVRIGTTDAPSHFVRGWLDYDTLIAQRTALISDLRFADFVLIYSVVPLLAGAIVAAQIAAAGPRAPRLVRGALTLAGVVLLNLALFQKRPLLLAILLIACVVFAYPPSRARLYAHAGRNTRRLKRWATIGLLGIYLVYLALLVIPVLRGGTDTADAESGELVTAADFDYGPRGLTTAGPLLLEGAAIGPVPDGSGGRATKVRASGPLQGVSYDTGRSTAIGAVWRLSGRLRSPKAERVTVLLGSSRSDVASQTFTVGANWRTVQLTWRAARDAPRVFIASRTSGSAVFDLDRLRLRRTGASLPVSDGVRQKLGTAAEAGMIGAFFFPTTGLGTARFPAYEDLRPRSHVQGLLFYGLFGPFTRTAGPAVAYPGIYPKQREYNHIDLGLDVLGVGTAPDDNATSFKTMFPTASDGVNSVPFQFTLYSQGGILVSLVGSVLLGVLWRAGWWATRHRLVRDSLLSALVASLLVLFGIQIAGDSARNAMLSSYGILWPLLILVVAAAGEQLLERARVRRRLRTPAPGSSQRTGS